MNWRLYFGALMGCVLGVTISIIFPLKSMVAQSGVKSVEGFLEWITLPTLHTRLTDSKLASSVWCIKEGTETYRCQFKNLYHLPFYESSLVFLLNEFSVVSGVESSEVFKQISLSSVANHTGLNLKLFMIKKSEFILQQHIIQIDKESILLQRFKPDNIMHVIHDDLLPLFLTFQELCVGNIEMCLQKYKLIFFDNNDEGPHFDWYLSFSKHKPILLRKEKVGLCIKSCTIGLSKKSVWFQYGFKTVQGSIHNPNIDGGQLRQFTKFIIKQFDIENLALNKNESISSTAMSVVFLNRKINRKILNELEIENKIIENYGQVLNRSIKVSSLDLSSNSSKSIVSAIQNTNFLIGMHGSAMILAMFLPLGSTIIELFPFGIQPEAVSPLKAMCSLKGVSLNYFHWVNSNERNTVTHPEYPALLGGIAHLQSSDQDKIRRTILVPPVPCCHNPVYLFRMFQDTIVDHTFFNLVSYVLSKMNFSSENIYEDEQELINLYYFPPPVIKVQCECFEGNLKIMWSFPFNSSSETKFSLATDSGVFVTTKDHFYLLGKELCQNENIGFEKDTRPSKHISTWIKSIEGVKESVDTYHLCSL